MVRCLECGKAASVQLNWCGTMGPQEVTMCNEHASVWWTTWKNTPAGQTVAFTPIEIDKHEQE